jgi:hypothetical protein
MGPLLTAGLGTFLRANNKAVVIEFRDALPIEERSRLEVRILQSHEALPAEAQEAAGVAALPLLPPGPIRKREWTKKKTQVRPM